SDIWDIQATPFHGASSDRLFSFVSFNHGLNPHAYMTYRCIMGSLALLPLAYIVKSGHTPPKFENKHKHVHVTLSLLYYLGFKKSQAKDDTGFICGNFCTFFLRVTKHDHHFSLHDGIGLSLNLYFASLTYSSLTFIASMLNAVGTLVSLAGAMTVSLYKGPDVRSVNSAPIHIAKSIVHESWMTGSIFAVVSCMSWSSAGMTNINFRR
ncbi:hypothetical protein RJ641_031311, partial [Dillenia turbinata]